MWTKILNIVRCKYLQNLECLSFKLFALKCFMFLDYFCLLKLVCRLFFLNLISKWWISLRNDKILHVARKLSPLSIINDFLCGIFNMYQLWVRTRNSNRVKNMYIFRKYVKVIFKYSSLLFQNGITLFIYPLLFKPLLWPHLPPPPPTPHPQKWTKDLFKNNRICKNRTNYKTPFRVGVIYAWFLNNLTWFSTKIHWNTRLATSDAFHMFTQSIKFFKFYYRTDVWKT